MNTLYYIFRHGKTLYHKIDRLRAISPEGKKESYHIYKKTKGVSFDLKIISSATRTQQTAAVLEPNRKLPEVKLESLYLPKDPELRGKIVQMIENSSKNAPSCYLNQDTWKQYAEEALYEINQAVQVHKAKKVLIVGHGTIINLIGIHLAPKSYPLLHTRSFANSEGFCLNQEKIKIISSSILN